MIPLSTGLVAAKLNSDAKIKAAKQSIIQTVEEYRRQLTTVRPPCSDLVHSYEELLESFAECRGAKLYFPFIGSGMGNGTLVELLDGSVKYDMISGIGSHFWGHHHPDILRIGLDAALADTIMQGHLQQNVDSVEISILLQKVSGLDHCFLCSSGAMANENALKLAFQKKHPATRILAFEKCFMGRTLAGSQITDKPSFREGLPLNMHVDYLPFYREDFPEESTAETVNTLKKLLARYPGQYAAICLELVQGEAGFFPGSKKFFESVLEIIKEHQIAVVIDEIQTFGRTPELFAFQYFGLERYVDIVTIGKLSQVCATLFRKEYKPRPGLLSQTFTSSTSAIRAGRFIIQSLTEGNYYGSRGIIARVHEHFVANLREIEKRHPDLLSGPYGIGAMIAFTPFSGDFNRVTDFIHRLFKAGVIGFIAGSKPTRARFLVPIGAVTSEDIDEVTKIVEKVLVEAKENYRDQEKS